MKEVRILLDNIRSAHNVGSIFRTADAGAVSRLYLAGITPVPVDRFGRQQPEIQKTSLGASKTVPWERVGNGTTVALKEILVVIEGLKKAGFKIVCVEQAKNSVLLHEYQASEKVLYIFGSETDGVQKELLEMADQVVEIPMRGQKESLNVSVSVGIVLFQNS